MSLTVKICFRHKTPGFSLTEIYVSFAVLAIVMLLILPKMIQPNNEDHQTAAIARDTFATIGEMYMGREQDTSYPVQAIGTSERATFGNYLYSHLNYVAAAPPGGVGDYCNTGNYFTLQGGAVITNICDVKNSPSPNSLNIRIQLPDPENHDNSITAYTLVIPEDTSNPGSGQNRYTTLYGFDGIASNCNSLVDPALHIVSGCP